MPHAAATSYVHDGISMGEDEVKCHSFFLHVVGFISIENAMAEEDTKDKESHYSN